MDDASNRLVERRPVTSHAKTQPDRPTHYGLIAEEVEEVMPELVVRGATGQPETVVDRELPAMPLNPVPKEPTGAGGRSRVGGSRRTLR